MRPKLAPTLSELPNTTWISGVQLCLWDNLLGPRVEQVALSISLSSHNDILTFSQTKVWCGSETPSEEVQTWVARHTLSGEIPEQELDPNDPVIESKFQVFEQSGV